MSTEPETLEEVLRETVLRGASDLHLSVGAPPCIRINGKITRLDYEPLTPESVQNLVYEALSGEDRQKLERKRGLDLAFAVPGVSRFRVNVYYQKGSVGAAFRPIPDKAIPLEELGLPEVVRKLADLPRGLVLVTGPTGSGKSTTLAAMIDHINQTRHEHIMSVEDPIEFLHSHKNCIVNQREVGTDATDFADALKHVLRQDPDVILVGEMRDLETISLAITAAETGHMVFATLHTQNAPQTVDRVIDVFPPHQQQQVRTQLAGTLRAVVTQSLIPTSDGLGRAVACEVMVATGATRNLIREGKTHQITSAMQTGSRYGMVTMEDSLADLVRSGIIAPEKSAGNTDDGWELRSHAV